MSLATPTLHPTLAAFGNLGAPELIIIVLVLLLLFGGRKLPEVARGTGRALRIFKAETKGLVEDDDEEAASPQPRASLPPTSSTGSTSTPQTTGATAAADYESGRYSATDLPPTHTEG